MQRNEEPGPLVECFVRGARRRLSLHDAHNLFCTCEYAWCLPLDIYRWTVEEHSGLAYVGERIQPAVRRFGVYLHVRGLRALTLDDLQQLESKSIGKSCFHQLACRFATVFGTLPVRLRPYYHCESGELGGVPSRAYRMRGSCSWIVIVRAVPVKGFDDGRMDWSIFLDGST